jgi:hypothetical protein
MWGFDGYEDSPQAKLVATQCAACRRPLVDAESVQTGLGPICREKYGVSQTCPDEARREANQLIYLIAARQSGIDVAMAAARLRELGFDKLADIVNERVADVFIYDDGQRGYKVQWVWDENLQAQRLAEFKNISGRRWLGPPAGTEKIWFVPYGSKQALWRWLQRNFPCRIVIGPKGPFTIDPGC